jgi:hypothetical protein
MMMMMLDGREKRPEQEGNEAIFIIRFQRCEEDAMPTRQSVSVSFWWKE